MNQRFSPTINNQQISKRLILCITFLCALFVFSFPSQSIAETPKQKNLSKKISKANSSLQNSRSVYKKLRKTAEKAESELHSISKKLHQTETKINQLTTRLTRSNIEQKKLQAQTKQQKKALAQQMQALYTSGKQSHLRLLLKQDNPSDISRTVKYFEYMNQHRIHKIGLIKTRLDKIDKLQTQISQDSASLKVLQEKQRGRKTRLKTAVKIKEKAYKNQRKVVYSKKQKLDKLRKEEAQLQRVFQQLASKRRKEEQQRVQQKKLAKAKADAAKKNAQKNKRPEKKTVLASVDRHYVPNKAFSSLRGKLSWPVRGKLAKKYGSTRNSKQRWKGVIIAAQAGTKVHAVARGKVEFSGRLNGYGYLVIIRHDKNYRSLYAYNRSVYKSEGQVVKAGEIIAAVGNSGSHAQSGLYFEIRKGTYPQNPHRWVK